MQRAFDAFGKAHFQAKESGTWHREIEGILQSFNLQKSQYRLSYYLNVKLDLTGAVPVELAEDERDLGVRFYIEGRAEGLMPDASGKTLLDLLNIDGTTTTDEHREHQLLDLLERQLAPTLDDLSSLVGIKGYYDRSAFRLFLVSRSARRVLDALPLANA